MLVDDSASERSVLARLLRHEGYEVTLAGSGEAAFGLMHALPPDLIVLDVMMPDMDGIQVLEMLQTMDRWKRVPVVMLTGISDTQTIQRASSLGAREYFVKATFSIGQLIEAVKKYAAPGVVAAVTQPSNPLPSASS